MLQELYDDWLMITSSRRVRSLECALKPPVKLRERCPRANCRRDQSPHDVVARSVHCACLLDTHYIIVTCTTGSDTSPS